MTKTRFAISLAENQLVDRDLDVGTQGQAKKYVDKVFFNFLASRNVTSSRSASDSIDIGNIVFSINTGSGVRIVIYNPPHMYGLSCLCTQCQRDFDQGTMATDILHIDW
jgi:hypothetical protein